VTPATVASPAVVGPTGVRRGWHVIADRAPVLAATLCAYVDQIAVTLRPGTARMCEICLRAFAGFVVDHDPAVVGAADLARPHVEAYKIHLSQRRRPDGKPLATATVRLHLGMLRMFFLRVTEWDWDDAPARVPMFLGDLPAGDEPLPRFLDDARFARMMRAAHAEPDPLRRLVVELLARTGMRVGELCSLEDDAVVEIGATHWLRIPLGKLHNDRYIPLHPNSSSSSNAGGPPIRPTRGGCFLSTATGGRSTSGSWAAFSTGSPSAPGSATSPPTSSATPWPPRL
jgi:integrase